MARQVQTRSPHYNAGLEISRDSSGHELGRFAVISPNIARNRKDFRVLPRRFGGPPSPDDAAGKICAAWAAAFVVGGLALPTASLTGGVIEAGNRVQV